MNESLLSADPVDYEDIEEIDELDDPILDMVCNRPVDMYPLAIGQTSVDTTWQDMLSFVQSHSWTSQQDVDIFNNQVYAEYLEHITYALLSDLNQASQFLAALLHLSSSSSNTYSHANAFTKHPARKAFVHYIFGPQNNSDFLKINSESDFNQVLEYYDIAPSHVKSTIADYLQSIASNVYTVSE